jgi:hypothetical protein
MICIDIKNIDVYHANHSHLTCLPMPSLFLNLSLAGTALWCLLLTLPA